MTSLGRLRRYDMEPKFKVGDQVKLQGTQYKHGIVVDYAYLYDRHVYMVRTEHRLYIMDEERLKKED
jgi:hypothetical protein